ncbi:conserved hypothetical protein [Shewanella sp. W3-18-1]|uniref:hypothetical protein n=1 Tax=Shewanella sp. (strain W3-18-1) TaxID=351745 RepID=UPI00005FDB16|nr:hypothetical protein [Shewanella sp. W3-18-1]ABM25714.1 conserved hypothetical protein [Shewanella sp. W3-18-1]
MSAIANFRKRREAAKAQQSPTANETTATPAPENEALELLAALLGCDVDQAIEQGREQVEKNAEFASRTGLQFDRTEGKDQTAQATVTTDDQGNITSIIEHAAELEDSAATVTDAAETALDAADKVSESADKVSSAAGDLESAASSVDDSASNLAYTADDLGQVAAELKEATAELKKPSAAQESSHGAKAAAPKSNSKKSG